MKFIGDAFYKIKHSLLYREFGPNLVVNGDFSNGLTGWSGTNPQVINEQLHLVTVDPTNVDAKQNVIVEAGKTYQFTLEKISPSQDPLTLRVAMGTVNQGTDLFPLTAFGDRDEGKISFTFTAITVNAWIRILNSLDTPSTSIVDNVTIREVIK